MKKTFNIIFPIIMIVFYTALAVLFFVFKDSVFGKKFLMSALLFGIGVSCIIDERMTEKKKWTAPAIIIVSFTFIALLTLMFIFRNELFKSEYTGIVASSIGILSFIFTLIKNIRAAKKASSDGLENDPSDSK